MQRTGNFSGIGGSGTDVQAQNFPRLTLDSNFKRPAADFAIGREALRRDAGVHGNLKRLAAEWTLNCFTDFHSKHRKLRIKR
jgi:hypothetical protein